MVKKVGPSAELYGVEEQVVRAERGARVDMAADFNSSTGEAEAGGSL